MNNNNNTEYGIEITLKEPDDFLKIKETLTRLGIKSKKGDTLYQSVHILHKRGKYYLIHFKELFLLDGKDADFSDDDFMRRNTICVLLSEWKLCKLVRPDSVSLRIPTSEIGIIPFKDKKNYTLVSKYTVGNKK